MPSNVKNTSSLSTEAVTRVRNTLIERLKLNFNHVSVEFPDNLDTDLLDDTFSLRLEITVTMEDGLLHDTETVIEFIEEQKFLYSRNRFVVEFNVRELEPNHFLRGSVTIKKY